MFILILLFISVLLMIWLACCYLFVPNFSKRANKILDVFEEKEEKKEGKNV